MTKYIPPFSASVNVKLANGNYYNFIEILGNPTLVIEILKNIDNVTIDRAYCIKYDLIASIIISWSKALNNNLPEYQEITDLMHHILVTPDLYQHLEDKAVLPISINLLSDSSNLYSSNLLYDKMDKKISDFDINLMILETLDSNILDNSEKTFIDNALKRGVMFGNIRFQNSFDSYSFITIANNIKYDRNPNFMLDLLENIVDVNVVSCYLTNNRIESDFIDILISYNETFKHSNIIQYTDFKELLRQIAQNPVLTDYLKNLGATEHDLALLTANKQLIQEFAYNNTENSPQLFNNWRCMNLAIDIYQDNNAICNEINLFEFLVGMNLYIPESPDYVLPLTLIPTDKNLSYVNPNLNNHNTAILISNSGDFAWNNKNMCKKFEYIKEVFDQIYFYGDSIGNLSMSDIANYVKHIFTKDILINKSKTIHIEINFHGSEDGDNIIELVNSLPEKPQNIEVIYLIEACHSRHGIKDLSEADIIKKGNFIVAADYDESARTSVDLDFATFCKKIQKNPHSLQGYLDYFSQDFTGSEIFFSGKLSDGTILQNVSINEASAINHNIMISHDLQMLSHDTQIINHDNSITAEVEYYAPWYNSTNSDIEQNVVTTEDNTILEDDNVYTTTRENSHAVDNPQITFTNNQDIPLHGITDYTVSNGITG